MVNPKMRIDNLDVISISGDDAEQFLQGQITNDIKIVKDENKAIYAGYCSPKGRLLAFFLIIKSWNKYFLFCPSSISNEISKKISMFIMRSDVHLNKELEDISYFSFQEGSEQENKFKTIWDTLPLNQMEIVQLNSKNNRNGHLSITKLRGEKNRYFVLGKNEIVKKTYNEIYPDLGGLDRKSWQAADIEAKIPTIFKETQDLFIPQSLNLDLIDAINFKKGCYTGQEIVARTHYLGKPKRRMYLGSVYLENPPGIGESIISHENKVGQLINFYNKEKNFYKILFELRIEKINLELSLVGKKIDISEAEKTSFKL